jgi:hypothetical protein
MSDEHRMDMPNGSSIGGEPAEGVGRGPWRNIMETAHDLTGVEMFREMTFSMGGQRTTAPVGAFLVTGEMLAMLEELQWVEGEKEWPDGSLTVPVKCPVCHSELDAGHAPDCDLSALIERARGEV